MKLAERLKERLAEENPDALLPDGFDDALIGIAYRCGQPTLAAYSTEKCIDILEKQMPYEDAVEYFWHNIGGSWMGEHSPVLISKE